MLSNAGDASSFAAPLRGADRRDRGVVYSFVIPVFNEIETCRSWGPAPAAVMAELDGPCEVVFVDDGSTDDSYA